MKIAKLPLSRAFSIVCLLFTATAPKAKAEYTFTLIADSAGAFRDFRTEPFPSINAAGTVAFIAATGQRRCRDFLQGMVDRPPRLFS